MTTDDAVRITFTPTELPIGGLALVHIETAEDIEVRGIRFLGQCVPFHLDPQGRGVRALVGAGLATTPGRYRLSVECNGPRGEEAYAKAVKVSSRVFPEERLTLPDRMVEFPPEVLRRVRGDQEALRNVCARISPRLMWSQTFLWPASQTVLSVFGLRRVLNGQPRSPHSGVDLEAAYGTPVRASNSGRVALLRDCYLSGKTLALDHGAGLFTVYVHLFTFKVREGQHVPRGEVIGLSGSSGRATGPHLHWSVSLLGERVNPTELMDLLGEHPDCRSGGEGALIALQKPLDSDPAQRAPDARREIFDE